VATTNLNQLTGNAGGLTTATVLGASKIFSFTAGGKTFSFTSNAGNTNTIGDLISAINNPTTDSAGLSAYLSGGNLVVVDPNNHGNLAVGSTNTETVLGTLSNPTSTSVAAPTNIFLSDATSIGSSQISVQIGALTTAGITNGTGGNSVNLNAAGADITTQANAQSTLTLVSAAIANIASTRGTLGASVNRLTAASNVLNSQVQNLTSAQNTITAADIPAAVASLTKYSILEQTGIAALAQANQQQQLVLKLL
jgi:flagellin